MNHTPEPPPILAELESLTTYVRDLESLYNASQKRERLLETIVIIAARANNGRLDWTIEEIEPAKTETRTLMIGAREVFLLKVSASHP